ncbi:MAG: DMT family transporter [Phycisphaerales bacterium]
MRAALFMVLAIACEVSWAIGLKSVKGWYSTTAIAFTAATYIGALVFLILASKRMEIGVAYALWAGSGVALIAIIGIVHLKEGTNPLKLVSLALVAAGVVGLSLSIKK